MLPAFLLHAQNGEEEDPVIPRQPSLEHYAATWEKNPFEVKAVEVTQQKASFAEDWALAGISTIGSRSALLINKKTKEYKRVSAVPDKSGLHLVEISPNADSRQTSAVIALGSEKARVGYDAALSSPAPNPAAATRRKTPQNNPGNTPQTTLMPPTPMPSSVPASPSDRLPDRNAPAVISLPPPDLVVPPMSNPPASPLSPAPPVSQPATGKAEPANGASPLGGGRRMIALPDGTR